jgi:hypothetical protein
MLEVESDSAKTREQTTSVVRTLDEALSLKANKVAVDAVHKEVKDMFI